MNPEDQMQLDELSHPSKNLYGQAFARLATATLFSALLTERWLRNFCRGCQRDGNAEFSKTPGVSTTGAGPTSIEAGLPSPTTAPELLL